MESIKHFLWPAPSLRGWVRNQYTATPNAVEEPKVVPKPNRPQTCRGAVKEPMRNARTAAGFEPTPSKMPLCEASESLERQQASCPRHAKHKPAKMLPVTFGIHKTCLVAGTLAARLGPTPVYRNAECRGGGYAKLPKASNSSKIRAQGMQNTSQKKGKPKTVRSQPFHMVPKLLATDPKRPNATTSRARASQKRCVRNPSTRCRNCSFEAVKKNIGKGP